MLSTLVFLDLGSNNFTSTIPVQLGNLLELQVLRLSNNSLNGQIPYQLSNLQKVWNFNLAGNYLLNPDRMRFKGMKSLTFLWLNYNYLDTEVPNPRLMASLNNF
ncbi:hypothetical protein IFM89_004800 [Coptis chinensis]|uniref:Uncharacterized protein n=1 Tax=Coptis chinensis TaxID=261450 RepID=A0A835I8Y2_9MAGN|nr:hypothetical protein IFM89_004800 [Coptis chinensis]